MGGADVERACPQEVDQIDRPLTIASLILVATVTEAMLLLLPLYIGAISDSLSLSNTQVGLLGSADLCGIALATSTGMLWLRRVPWRKLVFAALTVFMLANLYSINQSALLSLVALRMVSGLAAGTAYAIALAGLCDTSREPRNTALMVCSQVCFGALGLYLLPALSADDLLKGTYLYITAWIVVAIFVALIAFPEDPSRHRQTWVLRWDDFGSAGVLAFAGTAFYFLTIGSVWGFLERIAIQAGMHLQEVGASLSLGYLISLLGSFTAAWLGVRLGRAWPLVVSALLQLCMLILFSQLQGFKNVVLAFFLINALFQICWSFIISYQITVFSDADTSGSFIPLYGTAMHVALALGPFAGASLVRSGSYTPILYFGFLTLALCYLSFLASVFFHRRALSRRTA